MNGDWKNQLREAGKKLGYDTPQKEDDTKKQNPKQSKSEVMSNLGYQFQSQEYYLKKTTVEEDVKAITAFEMSGHIKTMIERRCEELGELVKSNDMPLDNCSFQAKVNYPGLVVGLSNPIMCSLKNDLDLKEDKDNKNAAFKTGFSFDYTTGLPYIPGSSIKGMLRASILKYREDVEAWLENDETFKNNKIVLESLVSQLFGDSNDKDTIETKKEYPQVLEGDVFLDALVICGDSDKEGKILKSDYITPHPSMFEDPKPIHILALRPNVKLQFYFLLRPEAIAGISSEKRFELYKNLILDLGIGAKTNTGYGSLTEVKKTREEKHGNKR